MYVMLVFVCRVFTHDFSINKKNDKNREITVRYSVYTYICSKQVQINIKQIRNLEYYLQFVLFAYTTCFYLKVIVGYYKIKKHINRYIK